MPSSFGASTKSTPASSASSTPTQSTPKPTSSGVNATKVINAIAFQRPPARNTNTGQKSNSTRRTQNQTHITSDSKRTVIPGLLGRVSARDLEISEPTAIYGLRSHKGRGNKSIFEKINLHGGRTTYLGSGSFSRLEDCIQNCLSRDESYSDLINYNTRHSYSYKNLSRASVLDDYSYDGVLSPNYHISIPIRLDHHVSHHRKHASELSLEEIRQVNDALSKYGIPVFSHSSHHHSAQPHPVGEVLSVCRQLLSDPSLRSHGDGQHAVQHVWDNIHYHSPQTYMSGNAPPPAQGGQYPYNQNPGVPPSPYGYPPPGPSGGGQSAISRLFGGPQPNTYNPGPSGPPPPAAPYGGPPPQGSGGGGVLSRLFGGSQPNTYNPGPSGPPPPAPYGGPPPPQGPGGGGGGGGVLSRLFGGGQ